MGGCCSLTRVSDLQMSVDVQFLLRLEYSVSAKRSNDCSSLYRMRHPPFGSMPDRDFCHFFRWRCCVNAWQILVRRVLGNWERT